MLIRRLVFFSALLAAGIGVAAAQSSPVAAKPAVPDARTSANPANLRVEVYKPVVPSIALLDSREPPCYTIRAYQFALSDPSTGSPMLKNESSCLSAMLFQKKDVLELPKTASH